LFSKHNVERIANDERVKAKGKMMNSNLIIKISVSNDEMKQIDKASEGCVRTCMVNSKSDRESKGCREVVRNSEIRWSVELAPFKT